MNFYNIGEGSFTISLKNVFQHFSLLPSSHLQRQTERTDSNKALYSGPKSTDLEIIGPKVKPLTFHFREQRTCHTLFSLFFSLLLITFIALSDQKHIKHFACNISMYSLGTSPLHSSYYPFYAHCDYPCSFTKHWNTITQEGFKKKNCETS